MSAILYSLSDFKASAKYVEKQFIFNEIPTTNELIARARRIWQSFELSRRSNNDDLDERNYIFQRAHFTFSFFVEAGIEKALVLEAMKAANAKPHLYAKNFGYESIEHKASLSA